MMRTLVEYSRPLLVTGGVGFIGGNFVMGALAGGCRVINLDALTYAANPRTLEILNQSPNHEFVHGSIADEPLVRHVLQKYNPWAVVNFAAESHVDRSIDSAAPFWSTNVVGTCVMLEAVLAHWRQLDRNDAVDFRFVHVSTDEVFGSTARGSFKENSPYEPNSPYAASKASADHFVRAYHRTHNLPTLITHSVNNFGPHHFPEKLIPLTILSALEERELPVYGDGTNVREWIHVADNCAAISEVLASGEAGETYNIGSGEERANLAVVQSICAILDRRTPRRNGDSYKDLIRFVADRPGHDFRYSLDSSKVRNTLGWKPEQLFEEGLEQTIEWYSENPHWWRDIWENRYRGERLGLEKKAVG